jgi:Cu2+-exporting ATPase
MASWFIVRVLLLTVRVGVVWTLRRPVAGLPAVLAVLVATCPCALSLATPVGARDGDLPPGQARRARDALRRDRGLAHVDTVVLDKTGTLTAARPACSPPHRGRLDGATALAIAAALEAGSKHPLAAAFLSRTRAPASTAAMRTRSPARASRARSTAAAGASAGRVGRGAGRAAERCTGAGSKPSPPRPASRRPRARRQRGLQALFTLADELRADAATRSAASRELGLELRLASGDRAAPVAQAAARSAFRALSPPSAPRGQARAAARLQAEGHKVLMIGDGINDGPVLAAADVSMAMGSGSSIAHAASDLVLLRESLGALPEAIGVARRTLDHRAQNLRWAAVYNLACDPARGARADAALDRGDRHVAVVAAGRDECAPPRRRRRALMESLYLLIPLSIVLVAAASGRSSGP